MLTYSDGQSENLGTVRGAKGEKGDTGATGAQGEQGIQGEKGDKGDTGAAGRDGQDGEAGVGVASAAIDAEGKLVITYSDGTIATLGKVIGPQGEQGVQGIQGEKGEQGIQGEKGDKGDTGAAEQDGQDGVGISRAEINAENELVLTLSNGQSINLGAVKGEKGDKGDAGVGIANVSITEAGNLKVTLTNNTSIDLGNIKGADGIGITKSEINAQGRLVLTYSDGNTSDLGVVVGQDGAKGVDGKDGADGVGISDVTVSTDGVLVITLSNGEVETLGNIKGEKGEKGDKGDTGRGIAKTEIINGELWITYTDSTTPVNLGSVNGNKEQVDGGYIYVLLDDGTYGIKASGTFALEQVTIPASYNGVSVTKIMENGFADCDSIAELYLPDSLTKIGQHAFENCSKISNITIPSKVNYIGAFAFFNTGIVKAKLEMTETWITGNDNFTWSYTSRTYDNSSASYDSTVITVRKLDLTSLNDVANALRAPMEITVGSTEFRGSTRVYSYSKETFYWCCSDWVRIDL